MNGAKMAFRNPMKINLRFNLKQSDVSKFGLLHKRDMYERGAPIDQYTSILLFQEHLPDPPVCIK
jgi:hypothetical protein